MHSSRIVCCTRIIIPDKLDVRMETCVKQMTTEFLTLPPSLSPSICKLCITNTARRQGRWSVVNIVTTPSPRDTGRLTHQLPSCDLSLSLSLSLSSLSLATPAVFSKPDKSLPWCQSTTKLCRVRVTRPQYLLSQQLSILLGV